MIVNEYNMRKIIKSLRQLFQMKTHTHKKKREEKIVPNPIDDTIQSKSHLKIEEKQNSHRLLAKEKVQKDYPIDESVFKEHITRLLETIYSSALQNDIDSKLGHSICNALYYSASRMSRRQYILGEDEAYLNGLINDIEDANVQFDQSCYACSYSSQVFLRLKTEIITLLSQVTQKQ